MFSSIRVTGLVAAVIRPFIRGIALGSYAVHRVYAVGDMQELRRR
jgi:hypothetical protein